MMLTMNSLNTPVPASSQSTALGRTAGIVRLAAVAVLLGGAAAGAMAQYKVVGPDGSVTYTDKPPSAAATRPATGNGPSASAGALPYETRQASAKYPVTLYAAKACEPCDGARQWLRTRGIPFSEFTVDNNPSLVQFKQRFGTTTLPVITIGRQTVTGFSANDLQSYADAAGYPAQARLPGYAWPPATPLATTAAAPDPAAKAAPEAPTQQPTAPPTSNGIQF